MTKWLLAIIAIIAASAAASVFVQRSSEPWTIGPATGTELVLSVNGTAPARLEIRCDRGQAQARLYVPIHVMQAGGPGGGAAALSVGEEFLDRQRKTMGESENGTFAWLVAEDGAFAARTDAAAFIGRMMGAERLRLRGVGLAGGGQLASAALEFPLAGLAPHRARIAQSCGG